MHWTTLQTNTCQTWAEENVKAVTVLGEVLTALALYFSLLLVQKKPFESLQAAARLQESYCVVQSVWTTGDNLWPTAQDSRRNCYLRICGSDGHFIHLSVKFWILIMTIKCTVHWIYLNWITPMVAYGTFQENGLKQTKKKTQKSKISKYTLHK